ncbi:MAG: hypothetical protein IJK24_06020 [Oscillospiraceae bacterium]|nr:hypothetical protein [Oscillospiraceae bacterium]
MTQNELSREELEHLAEKELEQQANKQEYVERPLSHRVLAWILAGVMVVGVLLYFAHIAGLL